MPLAVTPRKWGARKRDTDATDNALSAATGPCASHSSRTQRPRNACRLTDVSSRPLHPIYLGHLFKAGLYDTDILMRETLPVLHLASFFVWPVTSFLDVESLASSFVKGMNSGAPGRYFRRGSGTLKPCLRREKRLRLVPIRSNTWWAGLKAKTYLLRLEVLQQAAERPRRRGEGPVQAVHVVLLGVGLRLGAVPDLQRPALVVGAVGARH